MGNSSSSDCKPDYGRSSQPSPRSVGGFGLRVRLQRGMLVRVARRVLESGVHRLQRFKRFGVRPQSRLRIFHMHRLPHRQRNRSSQGRWGAYDSTRMTKFSHGSTTTRAAAPIVALVVALSQAGGQGRLQRSAPIMSAIDSVVLSENDSVFVGLVGGFAVTPNGQYYISDRRNHAVFEFSSRGRHTRTIGRRGRGPGEFTDPRALAVGGDTLLVVYGGVNLHAFDLRTGKLQWQRLPGSRMLQVLSVHNGRVYANAVLGQSQGRRASLAVVTTANDSAERGGPLPAPFGDNPIIDQSFGFLQMALWSRDSVAVAFAGASDWLFVGRFVSSQYDSIPVPRVSRRGAPSQAMIQQLKIDPARVDPKDLLLVSAPWALGKLSTGAYGYVTMDPIQENNRITGVIRVTAVDPRGTRTCADVLIPVPVDPQPRAVFGGDTLFVLSQDETRDLVPRTMIRKYLVSAMDCRRVDGAVR